MVVAYTLHNFVLLYYKFSKNTDQIQFFPKVCMLNIILKNFSAKAQKFFTIQLTSYDLKTLSDTALKKLCVA